MLKYSYVKIGIIKFLEFSHVKETEEYANKFSWIIQSCLLIETINRVLASFFFLLFRTLMREKFNLKSVIVINSRFNLYIKKKLVRLLYLHCSCKKVVQKWNKENLRLIKNTLSNKSGNPESLKKYLEQLESSSTNVHIVSEDLLRGF